MSVGRGRIRVRLDEQGGLGRKQFSGRSVCRLKWKLERRQEPSDVGGVGMKLGLQSSCRDGFKETELRKF